MYTLYYSPGACSMAVHVVLEEMGAKYTLKEISLQSGQHRTPEFLKLNPRGQVPVLDEDGHIIREGGAILLHLLDTNKNSLLPASGNERTSALEWLMFCNATLHPAFGMVFTLSHLASKPETKNDAIFAAALQRIQKLYDEADARLAESPYLAGKSVTVADILFTVITNWSANFGLTLGKNVKRLVKEISSRPAYQKALQTEKVEYKAAA